MPSCRPKFSRNVCGDAGLGGLASLAPRLSFALALLITSAVQAAVPACSPATAGVHVTEWYVSTCPSATGWANTTYAALQTGGAASITLAGGPSRTLTCSGFGVCDPLGNDVIQKVEVEAFIRGTGPTIVAATLGAQGRTLIVTPTATFTSAVLDVTTATAWSWQTLSELTATVATNPNDVGLVEVDYIKIRVTYNVCQAATQTFCVGGSAHTRDSCGFDEGQSEKCDDGNKCTDDSCIDGLGCQHSPTYCSYGDPCVDPSCDPSVGCVALPKTCDDGVACTTDVCSGGACANTAIVCAADGNICTSDACVGGVCPYKPTNCDDANVCTLDTCTVGVGCIHTVDTSLSGACYVGPAGTLNVGLCKGGLITCTSGAPSACNGSILPATDVCDAIDNDCDGLIDEDYPLGQPCDSGDPDLCSSGKQICATTLTLGCSRDGAYGYWPMDEASGTDVPDSSGWSLHGTTSSAVVAGKFGNARSFSGTASVALPDFPRMRTTLTGQTIALWVRPTANQTGMLVSKLGAFAMRLESSGAISYTNAAGGALCVGCKSAGVVSPGDWSHVAAVWDGSKVKIYQNGLLAGTFDRAGSFAPGAGVPRIGCDAGALDCVGSYFSGQIDDVVLYDYALDAAGIAALVSSGVPSTDARAPKCGGDRDCNGVPDVEGTTDCQVFLLDSDGDGFGQSGTMGYADAVARWSFDDSTLSETVSAVPGSRQNIVTRMDGRNGKAIQFDNTGTTESMLKTTGLAIAATQALAVSFYVEISGGNSGKSTRLVEAAGAWRIEYDGTSNSIRGVLPGVANGLVIVSNPPAGWVNVALSWNGSTGKLDLTVGGANVTVSSALGTLPPVTAVTMGVAFTGRLDDVWIYKAAVPVATLTSRAAPKTSRCLCTAVGTVRALTGGDCNDSVIGINPGAAEKCDLVDQNCNGSVDESASADCSDGLTCTLDTCTAGTCSSTTDPTSCLVGGVCYGDGALNPANSCQSCAPSASRSVWTNRSAGATCDDGNACSLDDTCAVGGLCLGSATLSCDDNNPCTLDTCVAAFGCSYTIQNGLTKACYEGSPGTVGVGLCHAGTATCSGATLGPCVGQIIPAGETCDGLDNDCNTTIDDPFFVGKPCDVGDPGSCASGTLQCDGTVSSVCVGDGPVVMVPFEATTGVNTPNVSWGGKNAFLQGGATRAAGLTGFGQAAVLDGVDDYAEVLSYPALTGNATSLSLGLWLRLDNAGDTAIASKVSSSGGTEVLVSTRSGALVVQFGTQIIETHIPLAPSTAYWVHVAVTVGGGLVKTYINGEWQHTAALVGGTVTLSDTTWTFGKAPSGAVKFLQGRVDEIAVDSRTWASSYVVYLERPDHEACDGVDNDCNGATDSGYTKSAAACDSQDRDLCSAGTAVTCNAGGARTTCAGDGPDATFMMESSENGRVIPPSSGIGSGLVVAGGDSFAIAPSTRGSVLRMLGQGFGRVAFDATQAAFAYGGTYAAWVRFDAQGDFGILSKAGASGEDEFAIWRKLGHPTVTVNGVDYAFPAVTWTDGTYFHIAVVVGPTSVSVYLDGQLATPAIALAVPLVGSKSSFPMVIGARHVGGVYTKRLVGLLDEVTITSKLMSQTEVLNLFGVDACDGVDNDCDASIDEDFSAKGAACTGSGTCTSAGNWLCDATGAKLTCSGSPKSTNVGCDDGNPCTNTDKCDGAGGCIGTTYACDDGLACTIDVCTGAGGCTFTPIPDFCIADGACWAKDAGKPGTPCLACKPATSQTAWTATAEGGACTDSSLCTTGDKCVTGACIGSTVNCADGNDCTSDSCQATLGCVYGVLSGGEACDDGNLCTNATTCGLGGACAGGTAANCDDLTPCTTDSCNPTLGCLHTTVAYSEFCYSGPGATKGVGICTAGSRQCAGTVLGPCLGEVLPAVETCNALDDDCDGSADEDFASKGLACDGPDADACPNGTFACNAAKTALECAGDGSTAELCDAKDNDCNGLTDETFTGLGQPCDGAGDTDSCADGTLACSSAGGIACRNDGPALTFTGEESPSVRYTASDTSGNGQDGTLHGGMAHAAGVRGLGYAFDGTSTEIQVPASPSLTLGKTFTVALYFKAATLGGITTLIEATTGTCADYAIRLNASAAPFAVVEESSCGYVTLTGGGAVSLATWHHVALTADGTSYRFYVDGVLKQTLPMTTGLLESGAITLGPRSATNVRLNGGLDEVGVWGYALSQAQITTLVTTGVGKAQVEVCDSIDNDCDAQTDENATAELCDGLDNDCNGQTDEAFPTKATACSTTGNACSLGKTQCAANTSLTPMCVSSGPRYWYRFDEAVGTSSRDAVAGALATLPTASAWTTGPMGGAVALDGTAGIVATVQAVAGDMAGFTVEARFKPGSATAGVLVSSSSAYRLELLTNMTVRCTAYLGTTDTPYVVTGSKTVSVGAWSHALCAYDGGAVRLYVNGGIDALVKAPSAIVDAPGVLQFGAGFAGSIDEVSGADFGLEHTQVASRFSTGIPATFRTAEICDAIDNDCDGQNNEDFTQVGSRCDVDLDGCKNGTYACDSNGGVACKGDIPANGTELCNGLDDNCDGLADETFPDKGKPCDVTTDSDLCKNGVSQCSTDGTALDCVGDTPVVEACNGLDDDCDGQIDEDFQVGSVCDGPDEDVCQQGLWTCKADKSGRYCRSDGPIVDMRFDEGSGAIARSATGDGLVGAFSGAFTWQAEGTGFAAAFPANSKLAFSAPVLDVAGPLSVAVRAKLSVSTGDAYIIRKGTITPNYSLRVGSGAVQCAIGGLSLSTCSATFTGDQTAWHIFGCTYDGVAIKVWVDGLPTKTCAATGTPVVTTADPIYFGSPTGGVGVTVDWARVWSRALGVADVVGLGTGGDACDGLDNDCDGSTDEPFATKGQACDSTDADLCASGSQTCTTDMLGVACTGDVNKADVCNGTDDDCDGLTDEDFPTKGQLCDGVDADSCKNGTVVCSADGLGVECTGDVNKAELCDGLDNDCNGTVDDGLTGLGLACDGGDVDTCTDGLTWCDSVAGKVACDDVGARLWLTFDDLATAPAPVDSSRFRTGFAMTSATLGVAGKVGSAMRISTNSAGGLGAVSAVAPFDGASAFTVGAWVNTLGPFVAGQHQTILAVGGATDNQVLFELVEGGLALGVRTPAQTTTAMVTCRPGTDGCSTLIPNGEWHHVAGSFAGGLVRLYVDGVLVRSEVVAGTTVQGKSAGEVLRIGLRGGTPWHGLQGSLDELVVYTRALSAAEVSDLVSRGPNGDQPELCNGVDDDCDGQVDETFSVGASCDGPDGDLCQTGTTECGSDHLKTRCVDSDAAIWWTADGPFSARVTDSGTLLEDVILEHNVTPITGVSGGGLDFGGDALSFGSAGEVDVFGGYKAATWAAWIKPDAITGTGVIVATHLDTATLGRTWAFGRDEDGLFLRARTSDVGVAPKTVVCNATTTCGALFGAGQWTFVAVVFKTGSAVFYVNGVQKGSFNLDGFTLASTQPGEALTLGAEPTGDFGAFAGGVDDVRLYRRALSTSELALLYYTSRGQRLDLCDELDNDCDSAVDEDFPTKGAACDGIDSDLCAKGTWTCSADKVVVECTNESVTNIAEKCNGLDDDCDSLTDEEFAGAGLPCDGPDADLCEEGIQGCDDTGGTLVCQNEGPVDVWRFDEGTGSTAYDTASSTGIHDLVLNNTSWNTGRFGKGLELLGNGGSAKAVVGIGGTRTLTAWVKPTTGGYVYGQGTTLALHFGGHWLGGLFTHFHTDGGIQRTVAGTVPAGQWSLISVVMQPGKADGLRLYVNCALVDSSPLNNNAAAGEFYLGRAPTLPDYFAGLVDEVSVYDHVVSAVDLCDLTTLRLPDDRANRELCDTLDNDCNALIDDGLTGSPGAACDGADSDFCTNGTWTCKANQIDTECINETGTSKPEVCNGVDDDCNGQIDEGVNYLGTAVGFPCDPPGVCGVGIVECASPTKAVCSTGPGGTGNQAKGEACDNKDNDCDGQTDEKSDGTPVTENCYTGPAGTLNVGTCKFGQRKCVAGAFGVCQNDIVPAASDPECDGKDQDCDGVADEDYHDAYDCTVDSCTGGVATSVKTDSKCDDNNPCTDDTCGATALANGGCKFTTDNTNIPDVNKYGAPCQKPFCQAGGVVLSTDDSVTPDDGLVCTADVCALGVAQHPVLPGYCLIEGACYAEGAVNTASACKVCAPRFSTTLWSKYIHSADFDDDVGDKSGYTLTETVGGGITWGVDPTRPLTGTNSLYFGNPATRTYEQTGARVAGKATSPPVALPAGIRYQLTFSVWMETEGYTGSDRFDMLTLDVLEPSTGKSTPVWNSLDEFASNTDDLWEQGLVDLTPWAGKTIRLVYKFDAGDAFFNDYEGVYLDKIRLETGCCFLNGQCDTQTSCYAAFCVSGQCEQQQICSSCTPSQSSVVVLVDRSLTMTTFTSAGQSRWDIVRQGLHDVLGNFDSRINMGAKVFPSENASLLCDVETGLDLDFHSSVEALDTYLTGLAPFGQSPVAAALTEAFLAYQQPGVVSEKGNKYVILVTDGPDSCGGDAPLIAAALRDIGVRTIVVAYDSPATRGALTDIAVAGGLGRPPVDATSTVYFRAGVDVPDLKTALTAAVNLTLGEACNNVDDDCDGTKDEQVPNIACNIACNDGLGGVQVCNGGAYGTCSREPFDEVCDDLDNDCDGDTDETFLLKGTPCSVGTGACYSSGTYVCSGNVLAAPLLCDAAPKFGSSETCNAIDDDCDGSTDEQVTQPCFTACGTGTDHCTMGVFTCDAPKPKDETCNGIDDDCNGITDDVVPIACVGACGNGFEVCDGGKIIGCTSDGKPETCNLVDDDCDGLTDEDAAGDPLVQACIPITSGLVGACAEGTTVCDTGAYKVCVPNQLPSSEVCDNVDNDCNGLVDDTPTGVPITVACYSADYPGTADVGECKKGVRTCDGTGTLSGCVGMVTPLVEVCNGKDDDCDGSTDEDPGLICIDEPGCAAQSCLCNKAQDGVYRCYLD